MKVRLAFRWLSRRPVVSGRQVERLLGHAIHFMLLRRELLSLFRGLYDFIQRSYWRRRQLFPVAAKEARWAYHLLGVCSYDMRRTWSTDVTASDASLSGLGVCRREMALDEVSAIGSQREPWGYKYKTPTAPVLLCMLV